MELPGVLWFYFGLSCVAGPIVILLAIFGDRLEALSKRLDAENEGSTDRNRAWLEQQKRRANERDRLRELANNEIERLWSYKQRR